MHSMICLVFLIWDFIKFGTVEGSRMPSLKEWEILNLNKHRVLGSQKHDKWYSVKGFTSIIMWFVPL